MTNSRLYNPKHTHLARPSPPKLLVSADKCAERYADSDSDVDFPSDLPCTWVARKEIKGYRIDSRGVKVPVEVAVWDRCLCLDRLSVANAQRFQGADEGTSQSSIPSDPPIPLSEVFLQVPDVVDAPTLVLHTPGGPLVLDHVVGSGGFGSVWRAHMTPPSGHPRQYAVKVMKRCSIDSPYSQCQIQEAVLHCRASGHPNVATLHWALQDATYTYLVMDFVEGCSLARWIRGPRATSFNDDAIRGMFMEVLDAVSYCHDRGISHRDIKPENILVTDLGEAFLVDFGLSTSKSVARSGCGTTPYMSPESLHCRSTYPTTSDVWSLGVVLYEMINNDLPWKFSDITDPRFAMFHDDARALIAGDSRVSDEVYALLLRMFDPDIKTRISVPEIKVTLASIKSITTVRRREPFRPSRPLPPPPIPPRNYTRTRTRTRTQALAPVPVVQEKPRSRPRPPVPVTQVAQAVRVAQEKAKKKVSPLRSMKSKKSKVLRRISHWCRDDNVRLAVF